MAGQYSGPTPQSNPPSGRIPTQKELEHLAKQRQYAAQQRQAALELEAAARHQAQQRHAAAVQTAHAAAIHRQQLLVHGQAQIAAAQQQELARRAQQQQVGPVNLVIRITQPTIRVPGKLNPTGDEDTTVKVWLVVLGIIVAALLLSTATPPGQAVVKKATGHSASKSHVKPAKLNEPSLTREQLRIAAIIIAKGEELGRKQGLSRKDIRKAQIIGVATGFGESSLYNVNHGDSYGPDSIGVFQQRNPWGPRSQRTDPAGAATLFYTVNKGPGVRGLFHTSGWQDMTVTQAAHNVQHNRYPNAYAKFAGISARLVDQANRQK